MGYRLSQIATRTGDQGTTGLADGQRLAKDAPRIVALGEIDELNAVLGLLLTHNLPNDLAEILVLCQHDLFDLGGELAIPGSMVLQEAQLARIDRALLRLNELLPPLTEFILPGGTPAAAICHIARTVCRRGERSLVTLNQQTPINPQSLNYLNRLSDLLFVIARIINREAGQSEGLWNNPTRR